MAYEIYQRTGLRVDSPTLSIVPDGRIALNAAAARALSKAGIKRVLLLWDRVESKIAIKAAAESDPNGYAVSFAADNHSGTIKAKRFVAHIGWEVRRRQMVTAVWNQGTGLLEATLPSQFLDARDRKRGTRKVKS